MDHVGRFRIEARLGEGAMGVVYLATDTRLGRQVALKCLRLPDGPEDDTLEEFRARFVREARAAGALNHPGIVTIYDADETPDDRVPFIAMEYVAGESLQETLAREGALPVGRAVEIVRALAAALDAAHAGGIVHRDVKPANVLVRETDGAVKIADFGVARLGTSTLTSTGTTIGSPAYMSPEQVRGEAIDGRSDLFSLAVIAYEMLCGRRPFRGEHPAEVLYAVSHDHPPAPTGLRAELPAGLDGFFEVALAKDRDRRYADGAALAKALAQAVRSPSAAVAAVVEATVVAAAGGGGSTVTGAHPSLAPVVDRPDTDGAGETGDPDPARPVLGFVGRPLDPAARRTGHGVWSLSDWLRTYGLLDRYGFARRSGMRRAIAVACVLTVAVVGAWMTYGSMTTYLVLDATSAVTSGRLTVHVDGEPVYERDLAAPTDQQGFFKRVARKNVERFEARVRISPGTHEIAAHIAAPDGGDDVRSAILAEFERGETRTLELSAGRMFGSTLSLKTK